MNGVGRGFCARTIERCSGQLDHCYALSVARITSRGAGRRTDRARVTVIGSQRKRHVLGSVHPSNCIVTLTVSKGRPSSVRLSHRVRGLKLNKIDRVCFMVKKSLKLSSGILGQTSTQLDFSGVAFPRRLVHIVLLRRVCHSCHVVRRRPCRGWEEGSRLMYGGRCI